jgi:hypothetical protein
MKFRPEIATKQNQLRVQDLTYIFLVSHNSFPVPFCFLAFRVAEDNKSAICILYRAMFQLHKFSDINRAAADPHH